MDICGIVGNIFTNPFKSFFGKKVIRILMVGLGDAGKTTILYRFKLGEVVQTIPTIGFNVETIEYKNLNFEIWDMGGGDKIWPLYRHYFPQEHHSQDLIFVVDSSDREQIERASYELRNLWEYSSFTMRMDASLLVYANKQDLPDAMNEAEIIEKLGLQSFRNGTWHVQTSCAISGDGLYEGLEWLYNQLKNVERRNFYGV
ncbi:hypothetical protein ILUMI_27101 [Ignelater luminosus]|uniref:small monomeric GTPase n=1 Tax=Ignelater luminosus TaxID=2038154 RepID=A0A8K0C5P9_IGNLU|nr:hypothetical protein ILUMI_27101 [Ignelater luminosus]